MYKGISISRERKYLDGYESGDWIQHLLQALFTLENYDDVYVDIQSKK